MSKELTGDFRKYMDKNYLGSWDVPEGEDLVLTIDHVEQNDVKNERGSERKLTVHFEERGYKPMILNVTNATRIGKVAGSNKVEAWPGVRIGIYTEKVPAFGSTTDALRIREYPPRIETKICEDCHKEIQPAEGFSVNKIVTRSQALFGADLCVDCAKKRKEKRKEPTDE